jgi:hypothetical protein
MGVNSPAHLMILAPRGAVRDGRRIIAVEGNLVIL